MDASSNSGFAPIKPEFIIPNHERTLSVNCLSDNDKKRLVSEVSNDLNEENSETSKLQKLNNGQKMKLKGQNKARPCPFKFTRETEICSAIIDATETEPVPSCANPSCVFMHNIQEYLEKKPPDIGKTCYIYSVRGRCPRGLSCRFGSEHLTSNGKNIVNNDVWEKYQKENPSKTINVLAKDVQIQLRKKKYNFEKAENVLQKLETNKNYKGNKTGTTNEESEKTNEKNEESECVGAKCSDENEKTKESPESTDSSKLLGCVTDEDLVSLRPEEKNKIDWKGKLYLSPLTTVGNLPFRRVCCGMGVDITCGEMALAVPILKGVNQEWALTKRHSSEKLFGVQLCGNNPFCMTRCAQLLQDQIDVDFIDINLGCPIDLIYQQGGGSGLLRRERVLEKVISCMTKVMTVPLTVKLRTGVYSDKNIAHTLVPKFGKWGVSLITLHGRSREQRYTRSADWPYIEQCAKLAGPTPLFGNGDILSFEDYERVLKEYPTVSGVMIGRGALIKPWIFTEIKERRHWDISSSERFDILKTYVNYGLEHWGSDNKGVENTRRFLLEWLSFLHRYIPVGLLERLPQQMNQRPPYYKGRDELETLMASSNCADWIKISEMLLGPVPDGFNFLPKHKANSWK